MSAMQAITKAAESAGQKAPVTANKSLTGLQDFHTSMLDKVRENAVNARKEMDAFDYQYDKGQRVFTEDSAKKNRAPYEILERYRHGNQVMRGDHPTLGANMGQPIRDPDTGKVMRTPYEAGYRVRGEIGEMIIPESAIKGAVDKAKGGAIRMQVGGALKAIQAVAKAAESVNQKVPSARQLMKSGQAVSSEMDAVNRFGNGERLFAFHEMSETPFPIRSVDELKNFTYDQLLSLPTTKASGGAIRMQVGGLSKMAQLAKGAKKAVPEVPFSRGVKTLSREESDENLRKMLDQSRIKERLFHATPEEIKFFKPGGLNPKVSGEAVWLSNDPRRTPAAHNIGTYDDPKQGVNVMPVYVQAKNPMVIDDESMLKWAREVYGEGSSEFPYLMPKKWREEVMKDYDSIVLADPYKRGDSHEIIMFEPEKIKSATGNRGTYNTDTADITKAKGGAIRMQVGGLSALAKLGTAEKVAPAAKVVRGFTPRLLESNTSKMLDDILENNPKLTPEAAFKKAKEQAERKLTWERETKPALVKQYGSLGRASYEKTKVNKMQNTDEAVQKRIQKANEFLDQPTEPWTPPKPELQAFDRSSIKDAIEGFPSIEQTAFPRDIPTRASTSHVEGLYTDPVNRELIKKQITRGLPLGGETFYGSLYPIKQAVLEAGMPAEKFDKWVHSLAPASARNSIINETAVGQFLRDMNARGIPLTEENVAIEMAKYKQKFGVALPLMPVHREGVASVLEGGQDLREMSKANIPTNYKIPTYGAQKTGDFGKSVVLDVHEAAGQTQGSKYHPYFKEQGGFGNTEYNAGEQGMMGIAEELGIPGGMAQAGRWFGGGELTGLKSPRGDALDILERQVAYTLKQQGKQPNPTMIRNEILNQIKTGEGQLLPWYKSEGIPDVRQTGLQRKDGGSVEAPPFHDFDQIMKRKDGGTVNTTFEQRLKSAINQHMAGGGEVHMEQGGSYPPKKDVPEMSPQKYLELLALQPKLGLQSEKQIKAFLEEQYKKEKEEGFGTPQARMDRAIKTVTPFIGAGADIGNFAANIPHYLTEGVSAVGNYAMSKVPSMSKPASVLDTEGKGDRVPKYPLQSLPEFDPFYGSAAMQRDAQNAGLMGDSESPVYDTAMAFLAPYGAAKAPKAIKGGLNATRSGLENTAAAVRNPFQSATLTMEQVAPDLGQLGGDKFKELLTRRLTMNEGAPVSMSIMGGRKTDKTLGQGLYENKAGDFETNPMVGVNIPRAGNLSTNKKLLADIGTAGQELGQEMVAAHKFTPLLFGNAKDATAMMVRGADGAPLTQKQIIELAGELPNMIASHSPKAGGMFVAPFKGDALDYAKVQEAASKILGKNAQIKFGKADPDKDIMYRGDYKDMGARPPSAESIAMRDRLKKAEARIVRPPSKSQPVSNTQPPSLTSTLRSAP